VKISGTGKNVIKYNRVTRQPTKKGIWKLFHGFRVLIMNVSGYSGSYNTFIVFIILCLTAYSISASTGTKENLPSGWDYHNLYNEKQTISYHKNKNDNIVFTLRSLTSRKSLSTLSRNLRVAGGKSYRFSVDFKVKNVQYPANSVIALISHQGSGSPGLFQVLSKIKPLQDGWRRLYVDEVVAKNIAQIRFALSFLASAKGEVSFKNLLVEPITIIPEKTIRVSCISGNPPSPSTPAAALDYYRKLLEEAGQKGTDIVCTPEFLNTVSLKSKLYPLKQVAEKIPEGKFSKMFSSIARKYKMYIVASIVEKDRGDFYDTAVLYGRKGELIGKYRKTHLAFGEILRKGLVAGDKYPVFETDFGRIGILICYDLHFPEPARILSLKGVDMILVPNYGDARAKFKIWPHVIPVRAADNQCIIVSAVNNPKLYSVIVSRAGNVLAREKKATGNVITADVDLNQTMKNYMGSNITDWYNVRRQPQTYGALITDWFSISGNK
jgi:predicted amidohydrolase